MNTETDLHTRVQEAISSPDLQRNLRGQVRAGMTCLPVLAQNRLACCFSEHALRKLFEGDSQVLGLALRAIEILRAFLSGAATVHDVLSATAMLVKVDVERYDTPDGRQGINIGVAGWTLRSLEECCCKREMKAEKLILPGISLKTDAALIAQDMCLHVGRHAGGPDWDSDDKDLRQAARKRGKEASDDEAIWQLGRILEYSANLDDTRAEDLGPLRSAG